MPDLTADADQSPTVRVDSAAPQQQSAIARYRERLSVPLWWWPLALLLMVPVAMEIQLVAPALPLWLLWVFVVPLPVAVLVWLGRHHVEVATDQHGVAELRAGRAHVTVPYIARGTAVPASAKSAALGRQLDPAAYVRHQPWVGPMVLLVLADPADPTPYWLVSTRRPEAVLAALGVTA